MSKALRAEMLQLRVIVLQHPGMKMCNVLNAEGSAAQASLSQKRLPKVKRGRSRFLDTNVVRYLNFSSSYQVTSCEVSRGQGSNCDSCKCQMICPHCGCHLGSSFGGLTEQQKDAERQREQKEENGNKFSRAPRMSA